ERFRTVARRVCHFSDGFTLCYILASEKSDLAIECLVMNRTFTILASLVIGTASLAGGFSTRSAYRRAANPGTANSALVRSPEKYEADKIESDYQEAISTVEEKYAGEIDYEKATQAAIQGMLFT